MAPISSSAFGSALWSYFWFEFRLCRRDFGFNLSSDIDQRRNDPLQHFCLLIGRQIPLTFIAGENMVSWQNLIIAFAVVLRRASRFPFDRESSIVMPIPYLLRAVARKYILVRAPKVLGLSLLTLLVLFDPLALWLIFGPSVQLVEISLLTSIACSDACFSLRPFYASSN